MTSSMLAFLDDATAQKRVFYVVLFTFFDISDQYNMLTYFSFVGWYHLLVFKSLYHPVNLIF